MKQFAKILILVVILASSLQGCSWISKTWDERPSWMGGDKTEKEELNNLLKKYKNFFLYYTYLYEHTRRIYYPDVVIA